MGKMFRLCGPCGLCPKPRARQRGENAAQTLYEATGSGSVPCDLTYKSRRPRGQSAKPGFRRYSQEKTTRCHWVLLHVHPTMLLFPTRANIRRASLPRVSCGQQSLGFGAPGGTPGTA